MTKKSALIVLKILVSFLLVYIVFSNVDLNQVFKLLKQVDYGLLFVAFLSLNLSVLISAYRLNMFFKVVGKRLNHILNIHLYYRGMFFNIILPGGISGDLYKGYLLKKFYGYKVKEVVKLFFADRLNGLLALLFLLVIFFYFSDYFNNFKTITMSFLGIFLLIFFLYKKFLFKQYKDVFNSVFICSCIIQLLQLVSIMFIVYAMNITEVNMIDFLLIFLISSVVSVIPITIGGIGSREATFLFFSNFMNINAEYGIAIAFLFYIILVFTSLCGIVPINSNRLEKTKNVI